MPAQSFASRRDQIAFLYADDVWTVSRSGGDAERLTSNGHVDAGPYYSPDGAQIAYSAHLEGATDIYIVAAAGGVPQPHHPGVHRGNEVVGWSPDGKNVLVASGALSYRHFLKLFLVHSDGSGMPEPLPLPAGSEGSFSPDCQSIAYNPITKWEPAWKRYVGGQTTPIWIVDLKSLDLVKVPRDNSNDSHPVWVGNSVYFLSDRDGAVSLFRYDIGSKQVAPVVANKGLDLKTFQAGPGGIVYEQFGSIHLLDTAGNADHEVSIQIHGELPSLQPHLASVGADEIANASISPTGARAVFEAHGEIFTVPAEKGDTRNLTNTLRRSRKTAIQRGAPMAKPSLTSPTPPANTNSISTTRPGSREPTPIDLGPNPSYFSCQSSPGRRTPSTSSTTTNTIVSGWSTPPSGSSPAGKLLLVVMRRSTEPSAIPSGSGSGLPIQNVSPISAT